VENKSFFSSLFDFSFQSFITPTIIKILFVIGIILAAIFTIIGIVFAFIAGIAPGVLMLIIISPIVFILYVLAVRIYLEILIILFRIQNDIAKLADSIKE